MQTVLTKHDTYSSKVETTKIYFVNSCYKQLKGNSCNATYCGKIKPHFKVRMSEHLGISALAGKRVKLGPQATAVREHLMFGNHS